MRALYCLVDRFRARPAARVWPGASPTPPEEVDMGEAIVFYLALEEGDAPQAAALAQTIAETARTRAPGRPAVLHSFNHLSDRPLGARSAARLYADLGERVAEALGKPVAATAFGWTHHILLEDRGEPGSKGLLLVTAPRT